MARREVREEVVESFICRHPNSLRDGRWIRNAEIIDRQVTLPHGRLDILAILEVLHHTQWLGVIEVKARRLRERDIGQVLRYKFDVWNAMCSAFDQLYPLNFDWENNSRELRLWENMTSLVEDSGGIIPILIGSDISWQALAACSGARVDIYLWHHNAEENTMWLEPVYRPYRSKDEAPGWACNAFGRMFAGAQDFLDDLEMRERDARAADSEQD